MRNSAILWISHHSLEYQYSAKFREMLIKIGAKFDEKRQKKKGKKEKALKNSEFCRILNKNPKKFHEILLKF